MWKLYVNGLILDTNKAFIANSALLLTNATSMTARTIRFKHFRIKYLYVMTLFIGRVGLYVKYQLVYLQTNLIYMKSLCSLFVCIKTKISYYHNIHNVSKFLYYTMYTIQLNFSVKMNSRACTQNPRLQSVGSSHSFLDL